MWQLFLPFLPSVLPRLVAYKDHRPRQYFADGAAGGLGRGPVTGFRNLDLEAFDHRRTDASERFRVRINDSPEGAVSGSAAPRVDVTPEVRALTKRASSGGATAEEVRRLGELLGDLLFPAGPVRDCFEACRRAVASPERLRIRLQLGTCELADLPWEYAVVPRPDAAAGAGAEDKSGFLALDHRLALVRHEWADRADEPLTPLGGRPPRLVAVLATPDDPSYPVLAIDAERQAIGDALVRLGERVTTRFLEHATIDDVGDALDDPTKPVHVVHFAGHGVFDEEAGARFDALDGKGALVLEDGRSGADLFSAEDLALLASSIGIRLVVLGACESGRRDAANPWSGVVAALVHTAGIPAVVGMQFTIKDAAAVRFSRKVYELLADGASIEEAVTAGRLAIARTSRSPREWGVPVLYRRSGDGPLFPAAAAATVEGVVDRARLRTAKLLREWRADGVGRWQPATYVSRPAADDAFESLAGGEAAAMLVVAPSGYGKTTELCHRAEEWEAAGHVVLLLDASSWTTADAGANIASALDAGPDAAAGVAALAAAASALDGDRRLFVIVDAVNEAVPAVGPSAEEGSAEVIASLDEFTGVLPERCRLVAACSTSAWERVVRAGAARGRPHPLTTERWLGAGVRSPGLVLAAFDEREAEVAFERYRVAYDLDSEWADLPPGAQAELSVPLVLRQAAEAYRGERVPATGTGLGLLEAQWERLTEPEARIATRLAAALLACREAGLLDTAVGPAASSFRDAVEADGDAYLALVSRGVLTETYDAASRADRIAFTHTRFGAYAVARTTLGEAPDASEGARKLVALADRSPLAWDAARLLLAVAPGDAAIVELAADADSDLRQAAADAIGERFVEQPEAVTALVRELLGASDERRRGTAIKAVLALGTAGRDLLRWSMRHKSAELRRAVGGVLALQWEGDAGFTDSVLRGLSDAVGFRNPRSSRRVLDAIAAINIPIYIAHCDEAELTEQTAALWRNVMKTRMKLHRLVPKLLDPFLVPVVSAAFARPIGETVLMADVQPPSRFFSQSRAQRDRFLRVVPLVDPAAAIDASIDDLAELLESDIAACGVLGALVLAVHAHHDAAGTHGLFDALADRLTPVGRLWLLASFSVLVRDAPVARAWHSRVEALTASLAEDEAPTFFGERESVPATLGLSAVPAGLVAVQRGRPSTALTRIAKELRRPAHVDRERRLWASLGVVGLHRPDVVLALAWSALGKHPGPDDAAGMTGGLAAVRVVRPDLVDRFLSEIGAGASVRHAVEGGDPVAVRRSTYRLGLYNNAVYQALHYRVMREQLLVGGLTALGSASSLAGFVRSYTRVPIRMVRDADFDLLRWTEP